MKKYTITLIKKECYEVEAEDADSAIQAALDMYSADDWAFQEEQIDEIITEEREM